MQSILIATKVVSSNPAHGEVYSIRVFEIHRTKGAENHEVGNAGPHVRQTFLNDVFTFLTEVGNAGRIVYTGTSSVNSEFVTALNT